MTVAVSGANGSVPPGIIEFSADGTPFGQAALNGGSASIVFPAMSRMARIVMTARYLSAGGYAENGSPLAYTQEVTDYLLLQDSSANSALGGSMPFTLALARPLSEALTVFYGTSDQTAHAGVGGDYAATSGSVIFNPSETTKAIDVPIFKQSGPSTEKDFRLVAGNASSLLRTIPASGTVVGRIFYDAAGSLTASIDDPQVAEGYSGTTLMAFTATLSHKWPAPVSVSYASSDATGIAGVDYAGVSGTVNFAANQTKRFILVPVFGNATPQPNRTFNVTLSNPIGGVALGKAQGTGTIVDDDPTPTATTTTQYRLYNAGSFEHLYTTDTNEYAVLPTMGWKAEGKAYTIFKDGGTYAAAHAVPFYRLYLPGILQHHWTTDANEAKTLSDSAGWLYEGVAGYVLPSQEPGSTPLYRLQLSKPPLHLWTTDANERDVLTSKFSWRSEGIAGYVLP